ncbi:putative protein kinase RLK-Pelle-DLSV family [Helianthus debilis subsp. tardiflorus]
MLIYEYIPNKSLNSFIFGTFCSRFLNLFLLHKFKYINIPFTFHQCDWSKKVNGLVKALIGIGRGLLYLHKDSRLRIFHRDLKASNILLDKDMNPRISDFGLARSLDGSDTKANTRRVMGT